MGFTKELMSSVELVGSTTSHFFWSDLVGSSDLRTTGLTDFASNDTMSDFEVDLSTLDSDSIELNGPGTTDLTSNDLSDWEAGLSTLDLYSVGSNGSGIGLRDFASEGSSVESLFRIFQILDSISFEGIQSFFCLK